MKPILLRNVEMPHMAMGSSRLLKEYPADAYLYGHLGIHEGTVATLRRRRARVIRTLNMLHSHPNAGGWIRADFVRFLHDLADRRNLWLRTRSGDPVHFPWFDQGRLYNWAAPGFDDPEYGKQTAADEIRAFLLGSQNTTDLWLDQLKSRLATYMFLDSTLRLRDLADYSHDRWLQNILKILGTLSRRPIRRPLAVNGWWDWDKRGYYTTYENADSGNNARTLWVTVKRWRGHPGTILSINGGPTELHVRRVLCYWLTYGGVLWAENAATASYAWELKRGKRASDKARLARIARRHG